MAYNTLQDELLKTGHYVGLKFSDGWFFAHILETEYLELRPWIPYNENGERAELAPGEAGVPQDNEIRDLSDREIITPRENERELMFQTFMGISPSRLQVFPYFGRNGRPNLVGGSEPGKNQVAIDGYDSPYNNPTRQSEVITLNNMADLSIQPYNPTSQPVDPRLSFHINKFKFAAIENVELMKSFIEGQVNFRDNVVGIGARSSEQEPTPGWLQKNFGDIIYTTEEILEFTGESSRSASASVALEGDN